MLQFIFIGLIIALIGYAISCIVYIGKGIKRQANGIGKKRFGFSSVVF